ncbi:hypothetical protein, partial [Sporolactobacillus shoreae]|uniref:hypothetical protein n=1 Tax=Sporolactobacillus shoreae TaxID=1465501 RepID=UPI0019D589CE
MRKPPLQRAAGKARKAAGKARKAAGKARKAAGMKFCQENGHLKMNFTVLQSLPRYAWSGFRHEQSQSRLFMTEP